MRDSNTLNVSKQRLAKEGCGQVFGLDALLKTELPFQALSLKQMVKLKQVLWILRLITFEIECLWKELNGEPKCLHLDWNADGAWKSDGGGLGAALFILT